MIISNQLEQNVKKCYYCPFLMKASFNSGGLTTRIFLLEHVKYQKAWKFWQKHSNHYRSICYIMFFSSGYGVEARKYCEIDIVILFFVWTFFFEKGREENQEKGSNVSMARKKSNGNTYGYFCSRTIPWL